MDNKLLVDYYLDAKPALSGQIEKLDQAMEQYGNIPKFFGSFHTPIGVEFEMENMGMVPAGTSAMPLLSPADNRRYLYWSILRDGSLRNNGIELVSRPLVGHGIDYALHEVDLFLAVCGNSHRSSIRTSTHVHVDMSSWKLYEAFALPAFYALFEKALFSIQTENRQNNPYCYEITQLSPASARIHPEMKYCALNMAPIETQTTVEFRHGDFNVDMKTNRRWIQIVCKLMKFAETNKETLKELVIHTVATGDYLKLFGRVMGKSTMLFDMNQVPGMMKANAPWAVATLEVF
jgi:hypothetical protein